jgi:outer membrane protein assembly factor BamA
VFKSKVKLILFLFEFFIVSSSNLICQNTDSLFNSKLYPFIVDTITISGNETTEDFIILNELNFAAGDTLTKANAFYNRERVYSLGIFNRVYFKPALIDSKKILNIVVEESWYLYPIPFAQATDGDLDKLTYGVFLKLKNFRGRNEDLTATIGFGYDPIFSLNYYNPNILGNEKIFIGSQVGYSDVTNKSPIAERLYGSLFDQNYIFAKIVVGKRFDLFNRLYINSGFSYIETPFYIPRVNASKDRIDHIVELGLGYEHDTRDLIQFPTDGIFSSINYTFKGLGIDNVNYSVAKIDFREYRKILGQLISKWRFVSRVTLGRGVPYYDDSILGISEKIRGQFSQKFEGDDYYFGSLELYYPIITELNFDLTFIPIIPKELLTYRLGLYAQIFGETGIAKLNDEPFALNKFNSGYGLGITFLILPYQILRVEVAFNEKMQSQLIFDLGISF